MYILAGLILGWIAAGTAEEKTQDIRLMDVFVFGPLMIVARDPRFMQLIGGATIGYNGRTYLENVTQDPGVGRAALELSPAQTLYGNSFSER